MTAPDSDGRWASERLDALREIDEASRLNDELRLEVERLRAELGALRRRRIVRAADAAAALLRRRRGSA